MQSIVFGLRVVLSRPIRRALVILFLFCVVFFLSGPVTSLYNFIVDFYFPTLYIPTKRDFSELPVIKNQANFIHHIIEPVPTKDRLFLLVLISSGASGQDHVHKRMAIRNTWGKPTGSPIPWKLVFFLGKTDTPTIDVQRLGEAKEYGDMLIGDIPDTYRNITKKLMMAFRWASLQNYEYLLKTDDDVYINVPSLMKWIANRPNPNSSLYAGVLYRANVIRDRSHRHFVSWHDLPQKRYPWYPKGALYVLSSSIVVKMTGICDRVKQITVDDAYVGVLASYLGVQPIQLPGFIQTWAMPGFLEYFDQCSYTNIFGIADNLTPQDIHFVHQEVLYHKDSSTWMCIHIYHPRSVIVVVVLLVGFAYIISRILLSQNSQIHTTYETT